MYDDLHMGDFVAVVVSFANQKTEHAEGGVSTFAPDLQCQVQQSSMVFEEHAESMLTMQGLQACTWMTVEKSSRHPHGDAILVGQSLNTNVA